MWLKDSRNVHFGEGLPYDFVEGCVAKKRSTFLHFTQLKPMSASIFDALSADTSLRG
jgi:hypothetical protein